MNWKLIHFLTSLSIPMKKKYFVMKKYVIQVHHIEDDHGIYKVTTCMIIPNARAIVVLFAPGGTILCLTSSGHFFHVQMIQVTKICTLHLFWLYFCHGVISNILKTIMKHFYQHSMCFSKLHHKVIWMLSPEYIITMNVKKQPTVTTMTIPTPIRPIPTCL